MSDLVTAEDRAPRDWDGESYCCSDGCHEAATHSIPFGLTADGTAIVELVCCSCARAKP